MKEGISMECPFTWELDLERVKEYQVYYNEDESDDVDSEYPFTPLIEAVMKVYSSTIKGDVGKAQDEIEKMMKMWASLDQSILESDGISVGVLEHIIKSTQYHVYIKLGKTTEANTALEEIQDSFTFKSREDLATIYGCKTISLYQFGVREKHAVFFARTAVMINPNCPAWQYELGRILWITRREKFYEKPTAEEIESFNKAYELSGNPFYGIRVALTLREAGRYPEVKHILFEIYEMQPEHPSIMLRLALCFLRMLNFPMASKCLDYVETKIPESPVFLHYKGLYLEKKKKNKDAVVHFQKAAALEYFPSDMHYARCQLKVDKKFKYIKHLDSMVKKYDAIYLKQKLLLQIGLSYYSMHKNVTNAVKYILHGFARDSGNIQLFKNFFDTRENKWYNILSFLDQTLLPLYVETYGKGSQSVAKPNPLGILKEIDWDWSNDWWTVLQLHIDSVK